MSRAQVSSALSHPADPDPAGPGLTFFHRLSISANSDSQPIDIAETAWDDPIGSSSPGEALLVEPAMGMAVAQLDDGDPHKVDDSSVETVLGGVTASSSSSLEPELPELALEPPLLPMPRW